MNKPEQIKPGFKPSPLGPIPSDWEVRKFQDFAKFFSGGTPLTSIPEYYFGEIPFIKSGEIYFDKTEQFISEEGLKNSSAKLVAKGDLLYALYGANSGEVAISQINGAINQAILCIRHNGSCNTLFIYNFLLSQKESIIRNYLQGGQGNLSAEIVKSLPIPLPSLTEQRAIAACLSAWDNAITKVQALLAQKELRKKWLMQQLLTGKKRLKGFEKTQWHLKSLDEIAEFKNGKAHENAIDDNGKYIVVNSKYISTEGIVFKCSNENLCPLYIDDIVMVMSDIPNGRALAKCYYISENDRYTLNQRICSIRANRNIDSRFLFFILNRNSFYLTFDNGVGQTNLKKEEVLECPLLVPEKEEQTAIAQVLQAADKEIQLLKAKADKLKEEKKGLMQVLLTGKKRLNF